MNPRLRRWAHDWVPRRLLLARWFGWRQGGEVASEEHRLRELARAVLAMSGRPEGNHIADGLFKALVSMKPDEHIVEGMAHDCLPDTLDDPDQWSLLAEAAREMPGAELLDFGCGVKADHRRTIESLGFRWRGLEVEDSRDPGTGPQIDVLRRDPLVTLYDGDRVPLSSSSFDVVFSNQSLEHVRNIEVTLSEVSRLLRPRGLLVGSVSHLEPFHGFSTFNYTPHGFNVLCERHGLELERVSPGIDALTLTMRVLLAQCDQGPEIDRLFDLFHARSPLGVFLDGLASRGALSKRHAAVMKLNLCAQFRFRARKR